MQLGAELQVLEPEYLTEANILAKLRGTHVEHDAALPAASSNSGSQPSTPEAARRGCSSPQTTNRHVMKSSSLSAQQYATYKGASDVLTEVDFADPEEAHARLEDVRRDGTATNWLVFGHEGSKNTLTVLGSGGGGWDETVVRFADRSASLCQSPVLISSCRVSCCACVRVAGVLCGRRDCVLCAGRGGGG